MAKRAQFQGYNKQKAPCAAPVLVDPDLLQSRNGGRRQSRRILAEKRSKRLPEIACRDALQVKDRDQHFEASGAARVGRQDRRREANAPGILSAGPTVAHARLAYRNRADAGHDLPLGQMPVTHDAAAAILCLEIGMLGEERGHFGLEGLHLILQARMFSESMLLVSHNRRLSNTAC